MAPEIRRLLRTRFALLAALLALGCSTYEIRTPVARWEGDGARVELSFRGEALAIHAGGDFNDWNPDSDPFIRGEDGAWTCVLHMPPGRYAYLLVIETEAGVSWQLDPGNPQRTRDFLGRELSLLVVAGGNAGDESAQKQRDR